MLCVRHAPRRRYLSPILPRAAAPGLHYCAALRLTALDKAVTQSDADNPPSTALLRDVRADAQYHLKGCWLRSETVPLSSTACLVLLSSAITIRWIASPSGFLQPV